MWAKELPGLTNEWSCTSLLHYIKWISNTLIFYFWTWNLMIILRWKPSLLTPYFIYFYQWIFISTLIQWHSLYFLKLSWSSIMFSLWSLLEILLPLCSLTILFLLLGDLGLKQTVWFIYIFTFTISYQH